MVRFWSFMLMVLGGVLSVFGILVIAYAAKSQSNEVMRHFMMQSMFLGVAFIGALILYRIDYRFYLKPQILILIAIVSIVALALVITPGIAREINGSKRWLRFGPLSLQPVEFVKLAMIVGLSAYYEYIGGKVIRWKQGFLIPVGFVGAVAGLLVLQPDFGSTLIICVLAGTCMILAGVKFWRCLALAVVGLAVIGTILYMNDNRRQRLMNDHNNENYQATNSLIAFHNGGVYGVGLGKGMQKENYLPECHTDFIFAVIAEDFGLVATASIWLAFFVMLCGGSVIAFRARDKQGMILAFGATLLICVQGVSNMAVATKVFPTKGLALPFLSYGGSCLLSSVFALGILLGVGRKTIELEDEADEPIKGKAVSLD